MTLDIHRNGSAFRLTSLANDTRIALVSIQVHSNIPPQTLEYSRAAGEMKAGKFAMCDSLFDDLRRGSGDELDDGGRETSFEEDLVRKVIGVHGHG